MIYFLILVGISLLVTSLVTEGAFATKRGWTPLWALAIGKKMDRHATPSLQENRSGLDEPIDWDVDDLTNVSSSDLSATDDTGLVKLTLINEEGAHYVKIEKMPKGEAPEGLSDYRPSNVVIPTSSDDLDLDEVTAALKIDDSEIQVHDYPIVQQPQSNPEGASSPLAETTIVLAPDDMSGDLKAARTMTEIGTKLDLARAYVDDGNPAGARSILEEVLDESDDSQKQQAQQLLDSLPN